MDEVGPKLRDARAAKNLSLEDIAFATKIPRASLAHLEAGRYEALPAAVFVRGFIRAYARVVSLDANTLIRLYEATGRPPEPTQDESIRGLGLRGVDGSRQVEDPNRPNSIERRLDPKRKLVPLQPVSERREGGFRGGYTLLAVVAVGLLVAAWLLVGGKTPSEGTTARLPNAPVMHDRIDGLPSLDADRTVRPGAMGGGDSAAPFAGQAPR